MAVKLTPLMTLLSRDYLVTAQSVTPFKVPNPLDIGENCSINDYREARLLLTKAIRTASRIVEELEKQGVLVLRNNTPAYKKQAITAR